MFKLSDVKQKFFNHGQEFEVNEVYKVDGLGEEEDKSQTPIDDKDKPDCIVCFMNPKNVILLPCRHYCICQ